MLSFNFKKILIFTSSILYGVFLSLLPSEYFRDRIGYLSYAERSDAIFDDLYNEGLYSLLFNEPVFLKINSLLTMVVSPDIVPNIFVFFICSTIFYFVVSGCENDLSKIAAVLMLLFTPNFFHLQNVILRQGIATAILLVVCSISDDKRKWVICSFFVSFIHSSFFLVTVLFFIEYLLSRKKVGLNIKILIYALSSIFISISYIAMGKYFSVRQVTENYMNASVSVSGLAFLMWLSVFVIIYIRNKEIISSYKINDIALLGLTFYMFMYFFVPIAGRFIFSFLPFITLSLLQRVNRFEFLFLVIFVFINVFIFRDTISNNSLSFYLPEFF